MQATNILKLSFGILALVVTGCGESLDREGAGTEEITSRSVPAFFNHPYGVVTSTTFAAIRDSAWLREAFSDVEHRTTVTPSFTYTATYLNFQDTYLEIFEEGGSFPLGLAGVGLSDEKVGGFEVVSQRLIDEFGVDGVDISTRNRLVDGVQVPWFQLADVGAYWPGLLAAWHMEYVTPPGASRPPTRREVRAARYAPDRLANDIVGVMLALDPRDTDDFTRFLSAQEWPVADMGEYLLALSPQDRGSRRAIFIVPADASHRGLMMVAFALNRPDLHWEPLGDALLVTGLGEERLAFLWLQPPTSPTAIDEIISQLSLE